MYPLNKSDLATCLIRLRNKSVNEVLTDEEFQFYHKNRNHFNDVKARTLIQIAPYDWRTPKYKDEFGRVWVEERIGVYYHVSSLKEILKWGRRIKEREARKFLLDTPLPDYVGATSEMIIKRSGQRDTSSSKMETFNFGPVGARSTLFEISLGGHVVLDSGLHYKFDVAPHNEFDGYKAYTPYRKEPPPVRIIDVSDLVENGKVQANDLA